MNKDKLLKQIDSMSDLEVIEMMKSKKTLAFSLSELMDISAALGTYLESPTGFAMAIIGNGELMKLKKRIDSKIINRLGTYGIFVDELEEE